MSEDTSIQLIANLESVLHQFPIVQSKTEEACNKIAEIAREIAPVVTGAYRDGIIVQKSNTGSGVWRVFASDQKSSWVEYGTSTEPGQFIMRTATQIAGYSFHKKGA